VLGMEEVNQVISTIRRRREGPEASGSVPTEEDEVV